MSGRFIALCGLVVVCGALATGEERLRVVSLNPSLTATLLALGAGDALVGVDDWSARVTPAVAGLPRVGGLFNPSLESIVALEPDLVVLVPSAQQRNLRERLAELGIEVMALANIRFEELLASIATLGERLGRGDAARARVAAIRSAFATRERLAAAGPRPRAVLAIQRDPLYVVGSGSFLDRMLAAAGATNVAGAFEEPYPRVGVEWLIRAAPEVILDASRSTESAATYWARWPSLPAVAAGRVIEVDAAQVTMPGPHIDRALEVLADAVAGKAHPVAEAR